MSRSGDIFLWLQFLSLLTHSCVKTGAFTQLTKTPTWSRQKTHRLLATNDGKDEERPATADREARRRKAWDGAGAPREDLKPEEIPTLLMKALELNDFPEIDSGLVSMWHFAGGNTKHIFQHNMTEFIESAHETADTLPTSFYGVAMNGKSWEMETDINIVGGDEKNGWIATQVMKTITSDGRLRRWQWELRKNRRPPCLGCWIVESIGSSDRKGQFEVE